MGYLQQRRNIKTLPIKVKQKIVSILGEKYEEQSDVEPFRDGRSIVIEKKYKNKKAM